MHMRTNLDVEPVDLPRLLAQLLVAVAPLVEHSLADAVVAARRRNTAGHLLRVAKHRQTMPDLALLLSLVQQVFLSRKTPTVNNLRKFQKAPPAGFEPAT